MSDEINDWLENVAAAGLEAARQRLSRDGIYIEIAVRPDSARLIVNEGRGLLCDIQLFVVKQGNQRPSVIVVEHHGDVFEEKADTFPAPIGVWKGASIDDITRDDVARLALDYCGFIKP